MRHLFSILAALALLVAPASAQTIKSLGYNTTNFSIVYNGGQSLVWTSSVGVIFSNEITFRDAQANVVSVSGAGIVFGSTNTNPTATVFGFEDAGGDVLRNIARANLGFSTNLNTLWTATNASNARSAVGLGATWLTNTNVTNFRTAIGLGENSGVIFDNLTAVNFQSISGTNYVNFNAVEIEFGGIAASRTRTNLGLGPTNIVTFAGLTNNGDITIANTTASNGLLYIRRTNNEAFLGLANLIASNNTTVSNETLFRVGVSEATNKAAQFGFRSTNTNGNGVAVFSVFGFNALMQIGADASTNAVIYSGGGTNNEVMTLIRDGATEFARPLRFSTNAASKPATNAPANTTNVAAWVEMLIGTNSYRLPLYQ